MLLSSVSASFQNDNFKAHREVKANTEGKRFILFSEGLRGKCLENARCLLPATS